MRYKLFAFELETTKRLLYVYGIFILVENTSVLNNALNTHAKIIIFFTMTAAQAAHPAVVESLKLISEFVLMFKIAHNCCNECLIYVINRYKGSLLFWVVLKLSIVFIFIIALDRNFFRY